MDLGLGDANVVVAGGTKGIGLAVTKRFASEGANVAVLARGQEGLDAALAAAQDLGSPKPLAIQTDLRELRSITHAFAEIADRWDGVVNTLVNTVGPDSVASGTLEELSDDAWIATFELGTLAAVRCTRACLPMLRAAQWGRIVNLSAHSVKRQTPRLVAYTASKAALTSVSKNLSQLLAPDEIMVNTVSPGSVLSAGLRHYLETLPLERNIDPDNVHDAMRAISEDFGHPAYLPRAGVPDEAAVVIMFVGSPVNSYMTGGDINVDGGSDFV
jgi:NAD(P)-dependent dehydrogenase (short-subunit alcohol dehydrogenase family)